MDAAPATLRAAARETRVRRGGPAYGPEKARDRTQARAHRKRARGAMPSASQAGTAPGVSRGEAGWVAA